MCLFALHLKLGTRDQNSPAMAIERVELRCYLSTCERNAPTQPAHHHKPFLVAIDDDLVRDLVTLPFVSFEEFASDGEAGCAANSLTGGLSVWVPALASNCIASTQNIATL